MFLSNKLVWALKDHAMMRAGALLADQALIEDLVWLEKSQTAQDQFDRPVPIRVKIDKETGEIEG